MATTVTIYGSTTDGSLKAGCVIPFYAPARDAVTADAAQSIAYLWVGWQPSVLGDDWKYYNVVYRSYLYFDTSAVPAEATITAATLKPYIYTEDTVATGHDIVLYSGQPTYPSDPLVVGDFNRTLYASGGADVITIWPNDTGQKTFTLNATGRESWITKGGTTKLCLRSEFDVSPTIPNVGMLVKFYGTEGGGVYRPVLTLTYGTKQTVTTNAATSIGPSYATGNGTITDNGSDPTTAYGAIWNSDGSDPVDLAHADHYATGSDLAGGVFSAAMTGLAASTVYLYRAYATNAAGTGYGAAVEFTTSSAPAVLTVTTGEPADVGATTVTLRGTIVEDAGDTVSQHGFIWKLESDPYEEADPIHHPTGADNYVLLGTGAEGSFTTGVTGLDTGSVYLVRAFAVTTGGTAYGGLRIARTGNEYTDTFYGLAGDGDITYEGQSLSSYSEAEAETEGATSGDSMDTSDTRISPSHGHHRDGAWYSCLITRGYVYFDTSSIPAGATILSATLSLYCTSYYGPAQPRYVSIYNGQPTHPTSSGTTPALELGDFDLSEYAKVGDEWYFSESASPNAYVTLCTDAAIVTAAGLTKVMFYIEGSAATAVASFNSGNAASNKPKLVVTYSVPGDPPPLPQINVGGTMKDCKNALLRVGGQWRLVTAAQINVGGTWKDAT